MRYLRLLSLGLVAIFLLACGLHVSNSGATAIAPKPAGALRVATHNVHYILLGRREGRWSVGDWERRKFALDSAFRSIAPDLIAFQEMESFSGGNDGSVNLARDWLLERNPGYSAAASGDWRSFPSTQPILYRTERLRLLDQGWFFFSDTPDVIYSRTFNGSYPAFASWARFEDGETGGSFRVINVHFEYRSLSNRLLSAELVRDRVAPWIADGETVILAGDLNALHGSRPMDILSSAGLDFAPVSGATYHLDRGVNILGAIDHLAMTPDLEIVGGPVVQRTRFDGVWPSDHYPVVIDVAPAR